MTLHWIVASLHLPWWFVLSWLSLSVYFHSSCGVTDPSKYFCFTWMVFVIFLDTFTNFDSYLFGQSSLWPFKPFSMSSKHTPCIPLIKSYLLHLFRSSNFRTEINKNQYMVSPFESWTFCSEFPSLGHV